MDIKVKKGITLENIHRVMEWTNEKGAAFLEQWAGTAWSFPLTAEQLQAEAERLYSIMDADKFVGMMQDIRREGSNVHMGRFVLNPEKTDGGIGTEALQQFCSLIFMEEAVESITLNVYEFNHNAQRCYEKCGFAVVEAVSAEGQPPYRKMMLRK